jgi:SAM-dependent methyltransferase
MRRPAPVPTDTPSWTEYLDRFHGERAGITEDVLSRTTDSDGIDPYRWLAQKTAPDDVIVDIGCGSGPTHDDSRRWVGLDTSEPELHLARRRGRGPLVAARADTLAVRASCADVALSAMSLMVVDDPDGLLAEAARVLAPAGRLLVLVPSDRPLTGLDRLRYGLLLMALGRTALPFPQPDVLRDPVRHLEGSGFEVVADDSRQFGYPLRTSMDADQLVDSLYVAGISSRRIAAARAVARRWGRGELGIPLRRLVARPVTGGRT